MSKKKVKHEIPKITWQVDDGVVHEIPEGAKVTFYTSCAKSLFFIKQEDDDLWMLDEEISDL